MRRNYTPVVAYLALFVALGGGAYAAAKLAPNSVGSKQIRKHAVTYSKLSKGAVSKLHGQRGATGPRGLQGPAGPFPDALPAGKTLRGTFSVSGSAGAAGDTAQTAETFAFSLAAAPTVHVIPAGGTPPSDCPGSATAPAAQAGHLCMFEVERSAAVSSIAVFDPSAATADGAGKASRFGFGLRITSNASGALSSAGSWAVTGG
jgi:hypothetical protein